MRDVDVVVVGAGPAGAAVALALSNARPLRVVLLDDHAPAAATSLRLGETLPGAARSLLRALGVLETFEHAGHAPSLGHASVWGRDELERRDALVDPLGPGWRVDRTRFDRDLVDAVVRAGGVVLRCASPTGLCRDTDTQRPWRLAVDDAGTSRALHARFVVDATGRRSMVARRLGVKRVGDDHLVCDALVVSQPAATDLDAFSLVEATRDGWYYSARLASGERLVAFHGDYDLGAAFSRSASDFVERARATHTIEHFLDRADATRRVVRVPAWGARLATVRGPGWAAVGDAACSVDPLSSQGLFNALYGGVRLGPAIASSLDTGSDATLIAYAAEVDAVWQAYRHHRRVYYASETRWIDAPFWSRRSRRFGSRVVSRQLAQRALERLGRLTALDQVPVVDDDRRHRVDPLVLIEALAFAHVVRVAIRVEDRLRRRTIETDLGRDADEHVVIARVFAVREVRAHQRVLQLTLSTFDARPMQQPVRIERVVRASPLAATEHEAHGLAALPDRLRVALHVRRRDAVLAREMLDDLFALGRHLRIQFERLEAEVGLHDAVESRQRFLERVEADRAPRTDDVGDEVDLHEVARAGSFQFGRTKWHV